ncbi:MAG: TetR/AcrR family transcriptional regulator [Spongiibacteraceae bacterium]
MSDNLEMKQKIKNEFFQCMLEMPYHKITTIKLAERLGMSRQNLYRYYLAKDDILRDILDDTLDVTYNLLEDHLHAGDHNVRLITMGVEAIIVERRQLANDILSCTNDEILLAHVRSFLRRVVGKLLRESDFSELDQDYLEVVISQHSGYGFYLVKAWAQCDSDLEPPKLQQLIYNFIDSLFKAVKLATTAR